MDSVEAVRKFAEKHHDKKPFVRRKLTEVKKVSGGLANYVFRLEFDDHTSVIAKYYAPYLAFDKTIEMSQDRYFVEKAALTLLKEHPWTKTNHDSIVRTPRVLLTDDESFVIVMEDAGSHTKTLLEHLKNNENLIKDEVLITQIAKDLHDFSNYLSTKSGITWETHADVFENKSTLEKIGKYISLFSEEQAKKLNLQNELDKYLKCLQKCFFSFQDPDAAREQGLKRVFSFGDLWPNSILVDTKNLRLWVVDWEVACFETANRDLQQLMANFWVMRQNESLFNANSIDRLMKRLQFEFFGDENKDWRVYSGSNSKETFILWITTLVKEKHWELNDQRAAVLNALKEVDSLN